MLVTARVRLCGALLVVAPVRERNRHLVVGDLVEQHAPLAVRLLARLHGACSCARHLERSRRVLALHSRHDGQRGLGSKSIGLGQRARGTREAHRGCRRHNNTYARTRRDVSNTDTGDKRQEKPTLRQARTTPPKRLTAQNQTRRSCDPVAHHCSARDPVHQPAVWVRVPSSARAVARPASGPGRDPAPSPLSLLG